MKQIRQALPHGKAHGACLCAAVAVTALLTACSSSPASTGATGSSGSTSSSGSSGSSDTGGSTNSQLVAYSQCMRSHGVPNWPDPPSSGKFIIPSAQQLGVSDSAVQAAENACQHLRVNSGGGPPSAATLRQQWSDMTKFAQCMRFHGVANWPDPTRYPPDPTRPTFQLQPVGINPNSPQISTKINQCQTLMNFPGGNFIG